MPPLRLLLAACCVLAGCGPAARPAATAPAAPASQSPATADWRARTLAIGNGSVQVVADPGLGGRLLAYGPPGGNILYDDAAHPNWYFPHDNHWIGPAAGRFDVGPEEVIPEHPVLWTGAWTGQRTDDLHIVLSSPPDPASGLQLERRFALDPSGSHLRCTQVMRNITDRTLRRAYWGRSMVAGGGIVVVPVAADSRYPNGYLTYAGWPDYRINMRPKDPAVTVRDGCAIVGPGLATKLGFDGTAGWIAYLTRSGTLLLKRYPVDPARRYADIAGLTASLWSDGQGVLEVEPLGPEEVLAPGASAAFSEDWWLLPFPWPGDPAKVDLEAVRRAIAEAITTP